jgi:hypothetical protein
MSIGLNLLSHDAQNVLNNVLTNALNKTVISTNKLYLFQRAFISPYIGLRGIREVHSLLWYKDRLLAGIGPVKASLYDVLTGEEIARSPYGWSDMWAKFYHQNRDIVLIGPFLYDGDKVKVLPAVPGPDWYVYWYALDLNDPENYVILGTFDTGIYRLNLNTLEVSKLVDYPSGYWGSRSGVMKTDGRVGRNRLAVCFSKNAGLYAYDPMQGWVRIYPDIAWMAINTPSNGSGWPMLAVGYKGSGYNPDAYAIAYVDDADRIAYIALLPREPYTYDRSEINNWLLYLNHSLQFFANIGDMMYLVGDWKGGYGATYIGTAPYHIFSAEKFGNIIAFGTGAKGALGGLSNPYWGTDAGGVELVRTSELQQFLIKTPGVAVPWRNASVSAGQRSLPVITAGWSRKTLLAVSDTTGNLTIEVDMDGSGDFKTYDIVSLTANTPKIYVFSGDFLSVRFYMDVNSVVTLKLFVSP